MGVGNLALHPHGQETLHDAPSTPRPAPSPETSAARSSAAPTRSITIAELALRSGELPVTGGVKPHVTVTLTLETLTGSSKQPPPATPFGATTSSEWANRVACDATVARIVFGPHSEPLDLGRASGPSPPPRPAPSSPATDLHLARLRRPTLVVDIHHIVHWADGGTTNLNNGVLLCGRHHDHTHAHGYTIDLHPNGGYTSGSCSGTDPHWRGHPHRAGP